MDLGVDVSPADMDSMIKRQRDDHYALLSPILARGVVKLQPEEHFVCAALVRSLALMDGFETLVAQRNKLAAIPLIRLQLDSAMRVVACSLVDSPRALAFHMLEGGTPGKFNSRDGKKLTDKVLRDELNNRTDHVNEVYEFSSGFIHLSREHLFALFSRTSLENSQAEFAHSIVPEIAEDEVVETLIVFGWATEELLDACKDLLGAARK